jgi:hypothetical protein
VPAYLENQQEELDKYREQGDFSPRQMQAAAGSDAGPEPGTAYYVVDSDPYTPSDEYEGMDGLDF